MSAAVFSPSPAAAQGVITTLAGTEWLFPGDRPALTAPIGGTFYQGMSADRTGAYYIADSDNGMVFKVTPDGILHIFAGNGITIPESSGDGGPATSASLGSPQDVTVDANGNVIILDGLGVIRKVTPAGIITTIAGAREAGFAGDGQSALKARFSEPYAIAADVITGSIYVTDKGNNRVRKITPDGIINTIAGIGQEGYSGDGGPATAAQLKGPQGICLDAAGNLYIADTQNGVIRMVTPQGIISTFAGSSAVNGVYQGSTTNGIPAVNAALIPSAVLADQAGDIFISDFFTNRIRVVINGTIYTLAGTGVKGFSGDGGQSLQAMLNNPTGMTFDADGNLLIADTGNRRIRKVDIDLSIDTVAGNGQFRLSGEDGASTSATLYEPNGVTVDRAGNVYIVEQSQARVRRITPDGIISTFAGTGVPGNNGDGLQATATQLWFPQSVAIDPKGSVYIGELSGFVRRVTPDGLVSTVAGNGFLEYEGDGVPATTTSLTDPAGLAFDSAGNLYIADYYNNRVRKLGADGIITTVAGNGQEGYSGNGGAATDARLNGPDGIAFDAQDNLYIADQGNNAIRKVTPQGIITTVAGNGRPGFAGDGRAATMANLREPAAVFVDAAGNLYIADQENFRIRKVTPDGVIATIAGRDIAGFSGDGGPPTQAKLGGPISLTMDAAGDIIFADFLNNRVRVILTTPPSFQTSPASLTFSAESGGLAAPAQTVQLAGSIQGIPFSGAIAAQGTPSWLTFTPAAGFLPADAQVTADPAGLTPGTYSATVNFMAPYAKPAASSVAVTFTVTPARPAKLGTKPDGLSFSVVQGASAVTQTVTAANQGGGPLNFTAVASTSSGGSWLSLSPGSGTATPVDSQVVTVTADPAGLAPGAYSGAVTVMSPTTGETAVIPATLTVSPAQQTIRLLQTGLTFTAVAGGAVTPPVGFGVRNAGQGVMNWTAATAVSGDSSWLSVSPDHNASDAASTDSPLATVSADPTGLDPGAYYGQVSIASPGADNSPQTVAVVLNVLPANSNPEPIAQPSALVFNGSVGAESPGSREITVTNLSSNPVTFTSAATTVGGVNWFVYLPTLSTIAAQQSARIVVQPDLTGLAAGVYRGSITLRYSTGGSSTIAILLVVSAGPPTLSKLSRGAGGCAPTQLTPLITSLSDSFQIAVAWPNPLQVDVVDDCGNPMVNGSVVASFSNGDPPRVLTHTQGQSWSATWQPGAVSAAPVTVTINAQIPQQNLKGLARVTGGLRINFNVPVITSGAVINSVSLAPRTPIAPGGLISILGSSLADSSVSSGSVPLQSALGTTSVLIAGSIAPLVSVSDGRIDAVVPYGVPPNTQQQVIVQHGAAITPPEPVTVAAAQPAIFTQDKSGAGQASVFAIQADGGTVLADSAHPVTAGDSIAIQCAGLGAVNPSVADGAAAPDTPPANTVYPLSVSIGGVDTKVTYAGLAPGAAGIYNVNATVPAGVTTGSAVPIILTVAGQTSPPVTIAVK